MHLFLGGNTSQLQQTGAGLQDNLGTPSFNTGPSDDVTGGGYYMYILEPQELEVIKQLFYLLHVLM